MINSRSFLSRLGRYPGLVWLMLLAFQVLARADDPSTKLILVLGAEGEPEYGSNFLHQAVLWNSLGNQCGCAVAEIGTSGDQTTNDFDRLKLTLMAEPKEGLAQLWLVLIGHGTFDAQEARFNLRGPDVSASDLASWLEPFHRPVVVINGASCSGPFLNKLSRTNRVIVTATRSGSEQNFARFGGFFAEALGKAEADLDKDGQVSVLEAFLSASRQVAEWYKTEGRLATEHALVDDNGDSLGTPADWFKGVRPTRIPTGGKLADGFRANQVCLSLSSMDRPLTAEQRSHRDSLEEALFKHRERKSKLAEEEYYKVLESILLDLARVYRPLETNNPPNSSPGRTGT